MSNLDIGVSGINAAQRGIEIIGNNIANAATEGYKRQEIVFKPSFSVSKGGFVFGQGVETADVYRVVDKLLSNEITRQYSQYSQYERELVGLQTIESSFSELNSNAFSEAMDNFFQSIREFSIEHESDAYENGVISSALAMSNQMNHMGQVTVQMRENVVYEAQTLSKELRHYAESFAYFNSRIVAIESSGISANDIRNERDQLLNKISELIDVQVKERADGSVDLAIRSSGEVLVSSSHAYNFEVVNLGDGMIGLKANDTNQTSTEIAGGKLGGLFNLNNNYLKDIKTSLDKVSSTIINEFNKIHLQGVGSDGSFGNLTGWSVSDDPLSVWGDGITVPGKIYVRLTETATDAISRHSIDVDETDTASSIAAKLTAAVPNFNASVSNSVLQMQTDAGYKFDFLGGAMAEPTTSMATGTSEVRVSGIYGGETQTYTATVLGTGQIGVDPNIKLVITNGAGEQVGNFDIGHGYEPGSMLEFDKGLKVSLGIGNVVDGETFSVEALSSSDETGFLSAAGINSFFEGNTATSMKVHQDFIDGSRKVAATIGPAMDDNENVKRFLSLTNRKFSSLGNRSLRGYYQGIISDLGQTIKSNKIKHDGLAATLKNLNEKQEEISGVDINTEATRMMMFEQMFQAMSKYLQICKQTMDEVASILR